MSALNQANIQRLSNIQPLIDKIDDLLDLQASSHHEYLTVVVPKGFFHWPQVTEVHRHKHIVIQMGVMGTILKVVIVPHDESDTSGLSVQTLKFDREKGESAYAVNIHLSPLDIRALVSYLISEFWPCSVSITESE